MHHSTLLAPLDSFEDDLFTGMGTPCFSRRQASPRFSRHCPRIERNSLENGRFSTNSGEPIRDLDRTSPIKTLSGSVEKHREENGRMLINHFDYYMPVTKPFNKLGLGKALQQVFSSMWSSTDEADGQPPTEEHPKKDDDNDFNRNKPSGHHSKLPHVIDSAAQVFK
ncbi:uncharacterized protein LOC136043048 [Artemia franciscana]|uniref:uncharacterized protein LOC136043048 n=1 Tax=Artemia franciscana TaxID=6661 RepID=UPI0032DB2578